MNKLAETQTNLPAKTEAEYILEAGQKDAGFLKMMKFNKAGEFIIEGAIIPLDSEYIVHARAWKKQWIKFVDGRPTERHDYFVNKGQVPPEREDMPDLDQTKWKGMDPWSLQYQVPMEAMDGGEIIVFVAPSMGGRRAVADVCTAWARKSTKDPNCGMPLIRLQRTTFRSSRPGVGDVARPYFEIIGWESGERDSISEINPQQVREDIRKEMGGDDIPF